MTDDSTPKVWRPEDVADLPEPAGAVEIGEWEVVAEGAIPERSFTGRSWVAASDEARPAYLATVRISGWQYADGRVERGVIVERKASYWPLSVRQTRELAELLLAVADECERLESAER